VTFYSRWFDSMVCPRCGRGTMRMIGNRRCVSCYNRERELKAGRNAKGTAPVNLRPLHRVAVHYSVDGAPHTFETLAADATEAMVQVLRVTKGRVQFEFRADVSGIRQGVPEP
jgi:hypothetical protein